MDSTNNFTSELADLVLFMSKVAINIRMYTPYCKRNFHKNKSENLTHILWLSDSIHGFDDLAIAIKNNNLEKIIKEADRQISIYKYYTTVGNKWVSDPMLTFKNEYNFGETHEWILDQGVKLLEEIKNKAYNLKG